MRCKQKLMAAKSNFQRVSVNQDAILDDKEKSLRLEHINTRLVTGKYDTMTKSDQPGKQCCWNK